MDPTRYNLKGLVMDVTKYKWKIVKVAGRASNMVVDCDPENSDVLFYLDGQDVDTLAVLVDRHNEFVDQVDEKLHNK